MFLFSKSIIPEDSKISRRDLGHVCVKTRFKAILKKVDFWAWIRLYAIFMDFCPWRATKSEAYVVPQRNIRHWDQNSMVTIFYNKMTITRRTRHLQS